MNSKPLTKLVDIGFGDVTFIREEGTETFFCLRIEDTVGDTYGFILGDSDSYSEERIDSIIERLEEIVMISQGRMD